MQRKKRVVVIGAGISGLTAAYLLSKDKYDVVVLEARERLGGRIDTHFIGERSQLAVEMGGEWIGKTHHRMQRFCQKFNLSLINHQLKIHLLYNGSYYKPNEWHFSKRWKTELKELAKTFPKLTYDDIERLEHIDWWHYLLINHIPRRDIEILNLIDSATFGEDIKFIPASVVIDDRVSGGAPEHASAQVIKGENISLINALSEKIGQENIKRNHEVCKIKQEKDRCLVTCKNGKKISANVVICTVPTFSLTNILWYPALPSDQLFAAQTLNYSRISKTAILFSERFWRSESFDLMTDGIAHEIYHTTQNQIGKQGVLTSYATGDKSYVLSNMSQQERIEAICRLLEKPFGDMKGKAQHSLHYFWGDDPYTKGAYAIYDKGNVKEIQQLLCREHGNVFFAGEHLSPSYWGFMEGALESVEIVVGGIRNFMKNND